jgi:transcriptional regulator with XRE-family HTH domain
MRILLLFCVGQTGSTELDNLGPVEETEGNKQSTNQDVTYKQTTDRKSPSLPRPLKPLNPDRSALDRLGYELRRWRIHRQLSQKELAQRIVFTRVHISLVETAQERSSRQFVERCDAALEAGGALLDVYEHVRAEHRGTTLDVPALPRARRHSETNDMTGLRELVESQVVGAEYLDDRADPEATAADEGDDLDRRTALRAMGVGAVEVIAGEPWERLTRALPASSVLVGLTGLEAEIAGYRWQ